VGHWSGRTGAICSCRARLSCVGCVCWVGLCLCGGVSNRYIVAGVPMESALCPIDSVPCQPHYVSPTSSSMELLAVR